VTGVPLCKVSSNSKTLLVFELELMYATSDRRADGRTTDADDRLMPPPPLRGRGHNKQVKHTNVNNKAGTVYILQYSSI